MMQKFFSVIGYGSSGKTTLIKGLVKTLKTRGYKIAVVKHDPKDHGAVDKKGSDTDLFWEAGSEAVILSSPSRLVLFRRTQNDLPLEEILSYCGEVDCVILEGYKGRPYPKVVLWSENKPLDLADTEVLALVCKKGDEQKVYREFQGMDKPVICRDDINGLADLLERSLLGKCRK